MSSIVIRSATYADLGRLQTLSRTTFEEAFGAQNQPHNMAFYTDGAFDSSQLLLELSDPQATFFLLLDHNQPIGYAKLNLDSLKTPKALKAAHPIELQRLYLLARYKGKGLGQLLMQTCLDAALQKGCDAVWLGVWEHNPAAIGFYRRMGFELFDSYIFVFGDENQTDLLMFKTL